MAGAVVLGRRVLEDLLKNLEATTIYSSCVRRMACSILCCVFGCLRFFDLLLTCRPSMHYEIVLLRSSFLRDTWLVLHARTSHSSRVATHAFLDCETEFIIFAWHVNRHVFNSDANAL